jgi:hypothetical protein
MESGTSSLSLCVRGIVLERLPCGGLRRHYTARMYLRPVLAFSAAHRLARFLRLTIRPETLAVTACQEIEGLVSL